MNTTKPSFKANKAGSQSEPTKEASKEAPKDATKRPPRKESAVVWEKNTVENERYLNIKFILPDGREMWVKAFKNRLKKDGDTTRPDYIAYEKTDKKDSDNA